MLGSEVKRKALRGEASTWLAGLLANVNFDSKCILWPFGTARAGYGLIYDARRQTMVYVHRVVCLHFHGHPADGRNEVAHACGNRPCVNPRHLRWASQVENAADKVLHGTNQRPDVRGERNHNAKLTAESVVAIKQALARGVPQTELARTYDVARQSISQVATGKTWRHVTPPHHA